MSVIKFRAKLLERWNTHKPGEWITFNLKDLDNNLSRIPVDWDTVSQFTGCHDKKGTEIYKGDIIENESGERYIQELCCLGKQIKYADKPRPLKGEEMWSQIIGNIYENPELLK